MRSPDVNVLVNACRQDAVHHAQCCAWLDAAVSCSEPAGADSGAIIFRSWSAR